MARLDESRFNGGGKETVVDASKLNSGLEDLDPTECMDLVKQQVVGRLGLIVDGRPEIHPVNFAVAGEEVLIRTDQGTKLRGALEGPVVFEVDHVDPETRTGWSVMLHGKAELTTARTGRSGSQNRLLRSWREAELPQLLRILPDRITGRRIPTPTPHRWPHAGSASP
jgi:nitroimidazol reductase NimA-like FMN-containing flavoprotein (pyridoxamine 5'-phosphate oxidase superfamily)